MREIWLAICLLITFNSLAQKPDKILSVKDMHSDLDYYFDILQSVHANPYQILNQEQWQGFIDSLKGSITEDLTLVEFLGKCQYISQYLDAHSNIAAPKKIRKKMQKPWLLPIFEQKDNKVLFLRDNQEVELTSIDNQSLEDIKDFVEQRTSLVEPVLGRNILDYIRWYCNSKMKTDSVAYTYKTSDNKEYTAYFHRDKKTENYKSFRSLNLVCDSVKSVALMEVNTFMPSAFNEIISFNSKAKEFFQTLQQKKIKTLYVDVTCNTGGSVALVNNLAAYFITEPEVYLGTITHRFSKHHGTRLLNELVYGTDNKFIQRRETFSTERQKPKFTGKVYVIQSRTSFSGAAIFASLLQTYAQDCTIVGQEGERKAFYANPQVFAMPKSKIQFAISSMFGRFAGKDKSKGVQPDIRIQIYDPQATFTIEDIEKMINQ